MSHRALFFVATALLGAAVAAACGGDDASGSSASGGGDGGSGGATTNTTSSAGGNGGDASGGGGQGGGSGGAGGQQHSGAETCPGEPYDLALGMPLTLAGTTTDAVGDYASFCGNGANGSGAERVYAFTATEAGTLTITLLDNTEGLNGVIYAQESCGSPDIGSFINCQDQGDGLETFALDAQQGGVYYVFVDGRDGTKGDYVLEASLQPAACGDGVINDPAEDCDFGDTNPGDGCDASCQFEPPTDNSEACPGEVIQIGLGAPVILDSFTTGYADDYTSCSAVMGSPDRVFAVFPQANGTLTVTLPNLGQAGGGFDGVLAGWAATCTPGVTTMPPYLGCSDGANASDTETLTFTAVAGTLYFIVVDGYANYSYGNFTLTIDLN